MLLKARNVYKVKSRSQRCLSVIIFSVILDNTVFNRTYWLNLGILLTSKDTSSFTTYTLLIPKQDLLMVYIVYSSVLRLERSYSLWDDPK